MLFRSKPQFLIALAFLVIGSLVLIAFALLGIGLSLLTSLTFSGSGLVLLTARSSSGAYLAGRSLSYWGTPQARLPTAEAPAETTTAKAATKTSATKAGSAHTTAPKSAGSSKAAAKLLRVTPSREAATHLILKATAKAPLGEAFALARLSEMEEVALPWLTARVHRIRGILLAA